MDKLKWVYASTLATSVAVVFATIITIWSELSSSFKASLTGFSGHHWTTKSIFVMLVYVIVAISIHSLVKDVSVSNARKNLVNLVWITIVGFVVIFAYYIWHFYSA